MRRFLAENPVLDGLVGIEAMEESGRTWMYNRAPLTRAELRAASAGAAA